MLDRDLIKLFRGDGWNRPAQIEAFVQHTGEPPRSADRPPR
jgi:hypothetical protein